jgi:uncharacterized protein YwqG
MADILAQLAKHGVVPTRESRALTEYAFAKPGVRPASNVAYQSQEVLLVLPHLQLPGPSWGTFYEVEYPDGPWATLYVRPDSLSTHRERFPDIRPTNWMLRDGHVTMLVPLDGRIPMDVLRQFVDDAYDIVIGKLSESDRLMLELGQEPLDDEQLLDRLIDHNEMQPDRAAIRGLARPALHLATRKVAEGKIGLGASKIGGRPDLPKGTEWPRYEDGQPLAFMGQINLADVAQKGSPFPNLPSSGLLSIFSVWGWVQEDDHDPQAPRPTTTNGSQPGWTSISYFPARLELQRKTAPRGLHRFQSCTVDLRPMLSLPTDHNEPSVRELRWDEDKTDRLIDLAMCLDELRRTASTRSERATVPRHQLGGYARFQQEYRPEVDRLGLTMLLQFGCDPHAEMTWGDDGDLIFYCDREALERGEIKDVWGDCQSS